MPNDMIEQDYDSCEPGLVPAPRKMVWDGVWEEFNFISPPGIAAARGKHDTKFIDTGYHVSEPGITVTKHRNVGKSGEFKIAPLPDGWLEDALRENSGHGDRDFLNRWTDGSNKVLPIKIGDLTIGEATGNLEDGNYSMRIWNQHFLDKIAEEPQEAPPNANDRSLHWTRPKDRSRKPDFSFNDTYQPLSARLFMPLDMPMKPDDLRFKDGKVVGNRVNLVNALAMMMGGDMVSVSVTHNSHTYELKNRELFVDGELFVINQPTNGLVYYVKGIVLDGDYLDCFLTYGGVSDGNV